MSDNWTKLSEDKEIKYSFGGQLISIKPIEKTIVPLFCPICEFPMKTFDDSISFKENNCCYLCDLKWKKPNINIDKNSNKWKEYIEYKTLTSKTRIIFK